MKALLEKQQQAERLRQILSQDAGDLGEKTLEQRIDHARHLQYELHKALFATYYTTIHKAAAENSLPGVKNFVNARHGRKKLAKSPLEEFDNHGFCAIHHAAEKDSYDVLRYIIEEQHCDMNMRTMNEETPFMLACKANKLRIIEYLVRSGADITLTNKGGMNGIHFAAQSNSFQVIQLLSDLCKITEETMDTMDDIKAEKQAATAPRNVDNVNSGLADDSLTIGTAVDISPEEKTYLEILNQSSNNKTTPLHLACLFNSYATVEALLQNHVLINYMDSCQETALHKAGRKGYRDIYSLLLQYGANEDLKNVFRETPRELLLDAIRF